MTLPKARRSEAAPGKLLTSSSDVALIAGSSVGVETSDSTGSGTVVANVGRSSWILTCAHVVGKSKRATVVYRVGKKFVKVEGKVERLDAAKDLALFRVKKIPVAALPIATTEPDLYEKLWIVGSADGFYGTACESLLCGKDGSNGDPDNSYQLSGFSSPGASGGTVGNFAGELAAVVTSIRYNGHRAVHGIVFAVPLPAVREFLNEDYPFAEKKEKAK